MPSSLGGYALDQHNMVGGLFMPDTGGFTIVEVLVALLIVTVGLLGTISTFAATARSFESGHSSVAASARALEVLEAARSRGCGGSNAGSAGAGAETYVWTVAAIAPDLHRVTVIVNTHSLLSRADTFSAILPC